MKMILSAIVAMSASIALANPPAHGTAHEATKETKTTTTTTETKAAAKTVDCKDMKNKDKAECKKAAH